VTSPQNQARLAVDIGGTFTDVVLQLPTGQRVTTKVLTTYAHPGEAVLAGICKVMGQAGLQPADVELIIHGTTLATNALIERRGAKTALLTTEGHRDALEMAHEDRFEQYDINIDRPKPLVPRYLRLPISERMDWRGNVLKPLDESTIHDAISVLDRYEIESVAIGYLHAYANPMHEQQTADLLQRLRPDLSITLASQVCPEIREYERLSTATASAYVRPLMSRYLHRLEGELQGLGYACPFLLMTSGGGLCTLDTAAKFPIRLVESGPAGGAILARDVAIQSDIQDLLSFDMGGTTAKLCMINNFEPLTSRSFEVDRVYRFKKGSGLPVRIPVIEMVEIGAGGGSIAHVDKLKRIQVGPESAGSEPGPAAYGLGGTRPAVTDADVHLGRVVTESFAGGAFSLQAEKSSQAIDVEVAKPLGLDTDTAALGISEVVDENMAAAARAHASEFGMDLAARSMVAFGGAAPLHAARLAEKLGIKTVIVPTDAGVGSAVGFLLAPVAYEVVRSRHQLLSIFDASQINQLTNEMRNEALAVVSQASRSGAAVTETRQAYMRYVGQGHEVAVNLPIEDYADQHGQVLRDAFESVYRQLYGQVIAGIDVEVLSWTLTVSSSVQDNIPTVATQPDTANKPKPISHQSLFDPALGRRVSVPVYSRNSLQAGCQLSGPALITEDQTTTVVTSSFDVRVDPQTYIVLTRKGEAS
jgi:N-methylhydantoinase A